MNRCVRKLGPEDVPALREIRLQALRLHPEAFSADLDVEESFTLEQWGSRLAAATTFGGFVADKLAGTAVFAKACSKKRAHTGELGGLYVTPAARGTGLADALVRAVIELAATEVEQLSLTVNAENGSAIKLYERNGFRPIGCHPNSLRVNSRTYDELIMTLRLSDRL